MFGLLLPIGIRILGMILDRAKVSAEIKEAYKQFVSSAAQAGVISVKLVKEGAEQRDRLSQGKWQKPGEDFSVPPSDKKS